MRRVVDERTPSACLLTTGAASCAFDGRVVIGFEPSNRG
jgi:hypothetical protein